MSSHQRRAAVTSDQDFDQRSSSPESGTMDNVSDPMDDTPSPELYPQATIPPGAKARAIDLPLGGFKCPKCKRRYRYKRGLMQHLREGHSDGAPVVKKEPKDKNVQGRHKCHLCSNFSSDYKSSLNRHVKSHQSHTIKDLIVGRKRKRGDQHSDEENPAVDDVSGPSPSKKRRHVAGGYRWRPTTEQWDGLPTSDPVQIPNKDQLLKDGYDESIIDLMHENRDRVWSFMRTSSRTSSDHVHTCNLRLNPPEPGAHASEIKDFIRAIHRRSDCKYKINLAFGFIMQKRIDEEDEKVEDPDDEKIRYWYPSEGNNLLFSTGAKLVQDDRDLESNVLNRIVDDDMTEFMKQNRPSTKWEISHITNVRVWHYRLEGHPILGAATKDQQPPEFITSSRYLVPLYICQWTGKPYDDHACVFRAIAEYDRRHFLAQKGKITKVGLEKRTRELLNLYCKKYQIDNFKGVNLSKMPEVELVAKRRVWVYELSELDGKICAKPSYKSRPSFPKKWPQVHMCVWEKGEKREALKHAGLITNLSRLAQSFACDRCTQVFDRSDCFYRHIREDKCVNQEDSNKPINAKTPGGGYKPPETIFDDLFRAGVHYIDDEHKIKTSYSFFDFETFPETINYHLKSGNQTYVDALHPLCVSISTNGVDGFADPVCFIDRRDPKHLIHQMVDHMLRVAKANYEQQRPKYEYLFEQLEVLADDPNANEALIDHYISLRERLETWIKTYTIFGFNSSRFDLNVCRPWLIQYLQEVDPIESGGGLKIIKRGHAYIKLQSNSLQFLDIQSFLGGQGSYATWLKAFGVETGKFLFPHTFLRSAKIDQLLDQTELPSIDEFNNAMTNEKLDQDTYEMIQRTWREEGWRTVEDYLIYYCNRDTYPALEMVNKLISFWATAIPGHPVNMMGSVSLPGLCTNYFHTVLNSNTFIALANPRTREFYQKVRDQVVGGPSIIWNRRQVANQTMIRAHKPQYNKEVTRLCIGMDANGLYLYALGGDDIYHATGVPIEWKQGQHSNKFQSRYFLPKNISHAEIEWLVYMAKVHEADGDLFHYFNKAQLRIPGRKFTYDGVIYGENRKAFNFYGCYFHPHSECPLVTSAAIDPARIETKERERQEAEEWASVHGYEMITIRECEWRRMLREDPTIKTYLSQHLIMDKQSTMSRDQLLRRVAQGTFFGYIEVDLEIEPDTPAWERCEECSPIYRHSVLNQSSGGPYMEAYAKEHNIHPSKGRMLIGAMNAKKMLFTNAYLQLLMELGVQVTKVYSVYEFKPKQLFKQLATNVTERRREADKDKSKKILGDMNKLTIENTSNRHRIRIAKDEKSLAKMIRSQKLCHVEELMQDNQERPVYEVISKMATVDRAPIIIGYTVLQYAKVKMLLFYFRFMDKYFDRKDWEMILTDTDSMYMAISRPSWEDFERECVKPGMEANYAYERNNFLPRIDTAENIAFDARTLGLFKEEWRGAMIIALACKTYHGSRNTKQEIKSKTDEIMSDILKSLEQKQQDIKQLTSNDKQVSKGINKKQVELTGDDYEMVLVTKEPKTVQQGGLKCVQMIEEDGSKVQKVVSYIQKKIGLSFAYFKRVLDKNFINTYPPPLDV